MSEQAPTTTLPLVGLANNAVELFESLVAQHGGRGNLSTAQLEIVLLIVKLHGDARATADPMARIRVVEAISRATALLPAAAKVAEVSSDGASFTSDGEIAIHVADGLSDADLGALGDALRAYCPSAGALADLVSENTALSAQLFDAQLALSMRDFERLNGVLMHVSGADGRGDLVEQLRCEVAELRREVDGLRAVRAGEVYVRPRGEPQGARGASPGVQQPPASDGAPRGSVGAGRGVPERRVLTPAESPSCQPPYAPGQDVGGVLDPIAYGERISRFDNAGGY